MTQLLCKIIGHNEFDPKVLAARPWDLSDFRNFTPADFRSANCLRCGESLHNKAA